MSSSSSGNHNFFDDLQNLCLLILKNREYNKDIGFSIWDYTDNTNEIDKYNNFFIKLFDYHYKHNENYVIDFFNNENQLAQVSNIYSNTNYNSGYKKYLFNNKNWKDVEKDINSISENKLFHITDHNIILLNDLLNEPEKSKFVESKSGSIMPLLNMISQKLSNNDDNMSDNDDGNYIDGAVDYPETINTSISTIMDNNENRNDDNATDADDMNDSETNNITISISIAQNDMIELTKNISCLLIDFYNKAKDNYLNYVNNADNQNTFNAELIKIFSDFYKKYKTYNIEQINSINNDLLIILENQLGSNKYQYTKIFDININDFIKKYKNKEYQFIIDYGIEVNTTCNKYMNEIVSRVQRNPTLYSLGRYNDNIDNDFNNITEITKSNNGIISIGSVIKNLFEKIKKLKSQQQSIAIIIPTASPTTTSATIPSNDKTESKKRRRYDDKKDEQKFTKADATKRYFKQLSFITDFYNDNDKYKTNDVFLTYAIADSVHDQQTSIFGANDIVRYLYGQEVQIIQEIDNFISNEPHMANLLLNEDKSIIKKENILFFGENDELNKSFFKNQLQDTVFINKTKSKSYLLIDDINKVKQAYNNFASKDGDIIGNLIDAQSISLKLIFYNTIKDINPNYVEISEESNKWDMAKKGQNLEQSKMCNCNADFEYFSKIGDKYKGTKSICDDNKQINIFNNLKDFIKASDEIQDKNIMYRIKNRVLPTEIDPTTPNISDSKINFFYNSLSYNLLNKTAEKDKIVNLLEYIEIDKRWNIYNSFKEGFDYTPYKFRSTYNWDKMINANTNLQYIKVPTTSSVNIYISSSTNDNCNSYIFLIRKVGNTEYSIILKSNYKEQAKWDQLNNSYISKKIVDLVINNNYIITGECCYIASLLDYKLDELTNQDKEYITYTTYYDKDKGIWTNSFINNKEHKVNKYKDFLNPPTKNIIKNINEVTNYDELNKLNASQFFNNGELKIVENDKIVYLESAIIPVRSEGLSTKPYIPITKISKEDINDFVKLLLDIKRSGDASQAHAVYDYNSRDEKYRKDIGISKLVLTTHDRLALLYARLMNIPTMFTGKDYTISFYSPAGISASSKKQKTSATVTTTDIMSNVNRGKYFDGQFKNFCGRHALNNLLNDLDIIADTQIFTTPIVIEDLNKIEIINKNDTLDFKLFYADTSNKYQINVIAVILQSLLDANSIKINQKPNSNNEFVISINTDILGDKTNITPNDTLAINIRDKIIIDRENLKELLQNRFGQIDIDEGNYSTEVIQNVLRKINNYIFNKKKSTNYKFSLIANYDATILTTDELIPYLTPNTDTLGYIILFANSGTIGHWVSAKIIENDRGILIKYKYYDSLNNEALEIHDLAHQIITEINKRNTSILQIFKLTKTEGNTNIYIENKDINKNIVINNFTNIRTQQRVYDNNKQKYNIDIEKPTISTETVQSTEQEQTKNITNIIQQLINITINRKNADIINTDTYERIINNLDSLYTQIHDELSQIYTKAITDNPKYYEILISMAKSNIRAYSVELKNRINLINELVEIINNNEINEKFNELKKAIDDIRFPEMANKFKLINDTQDMQVIFTSVKDNIQDGGLNNNDEFFIFEDLYYSLDDTDINIMIPVILYNCSKLVEFYLEYLNRIGDYRLDNIYNTIILLLSLKQDILDGINIKDVNMTNILKEVCSCLSLYNDSFILTLSNVSVKFIPGEKYPAYIEEEVEESYSFLQDVSEQIKIFAEKNKLINEILKISNKPLTDKLYELLIKLDKSVLEILKHRYQLLKQQKQSQLLTLPQMRTGLTKEEQQLVSPFKLGSDGRIPQSVYGGSSSAQFYIEYFMVNPDKIKKEDKKNIRNILKEEKFEDELADFIKSHLKL